MTLLQIFHSLVDPALNQFGYYDVEHNAQGISNVMYEFESLVDAKVIKKVQFQRRQYNEIPISYSFTVNIYRIPLVPNDSPDYQVPLFSRLADLIRYNFAQTDEVEANWWEARNKEEFEVKLKDAIEKIIKYGIPWLDNPSSVNYYEIDREDNIDFQSSIIAMYGDLFTKYDYHLEYKNDREILVARKKKSNRTVEFEFHNYLILEPKGFEFAIILKEHHTNAQQNIGSKIVREMPLPTFLFLNYSTPAFQIIGSKFSPIIVWGYNSLEQLNIHLTALFPVLHYSIRLINSGFVG